MPFWQARLAVRTPRRQVEAMKELIRTPNIVALSALKAALVEAAIDVFEFDGPVADVLGGIGDFHRRLFVHDDDYAQARQIAMDVCPDEMTPE
jgi:hypothetical protein